MERVGMVVTGRLLTTPRIHTCDDLKASCGKTQTRDRRESDAPVPSLQFKLYASPRVRQDVRISSPPSRGYSSSKTHSVRVEFTRQHDNYLVKYLATYSPSKDGRSGNTSFKRLVANVRPFVSLFCTDSDRSCRQRDIGRGPYTTRGLARALCQEFEPFRPAHIEL